MSRPIGVTVSAIVAILGSIFALLEQGAPPNYYSKRYFGSFVPWVFRDFPLSREIEGDRLGPYRRAATTDDQSTPTWR